MLILQVVFIAIAMILHNTKGTMGNFKIVSLFWSALIVSLLCGFLNIWVIL